MIGANDVAARLVWQRLKDRCKISVAIRNRRDHSARSHHLDACRYQLEAPGRTIRRIVNMAPNRNRRAVGRDLHVRLHRGSISGDNRQRQSRDGHVVALRTLGNRAVGVRDQQDIKVAG